MKSTASRIPTRIVAVASLAMALAACQPPPPPPPPAPPPAPVAIPQRPYPPNGASTLLVLPERGVDGQYISVNRAISADQVTWNLRAAYNVGALNCPEPQRTEITSGYTAYLKAHSRTLSAVNKRLDAEFKGRHGSGYIMQRERYMTEVYNHFAFPPTLNEFCNAVQAMGAEMQTVRSTDLGAFAARSLPNIELVFDDFYNRYATYRTDLAAWEAQYGAMVNAGPSLGTGQQMGQ